MLTRYARSQFVDPNKVGKIPKEFLGNKDFVCRHMKMKRKVFMMMMSMKQRNTIMMMKIH
jgi:hypothetical protein